MANEKERVMAALTTKKVGDAVKAGKGYGCMKVNTPSKMKRVMKAVIKRRTIDRLLFCMISFGR